ncbi:pyridoxamine 5'-phosphate oxidase family protein [Thermodesulfobacteriota bacterium]
MLEKMKALIRVKDICVLSTVSQDATPHCSLMAYVADEECREIYMTTHSSTMKYQNLLHNPAVSLLIDSRELTPRQQAQALTVSGIFQPIDDKNKKERVEARLLRRHPHLKEFTKNPDTALICIKVKSFLLLDGLTDSHFVNLKEM